MYIATAYIGSAFTPGEVLPDDYPADKLEWLIKAGAVRQAAPAPSAIDAEADQTEALIEEMPEDSVDESDEGEIDMDEEAPEINVMTGIVKKEPTESERPESQIEPRTAGRGKKAPKGGKTK